MDPNPGKEYTSRPSPVQIDQLPELAQQYIRHLERRIDSLKTIIDRLATELPVEGARTFTLKQVSDFLEYGIALVVGDENLYPPEQEDRRAAARALLDLAASATRTLLLHPDATLDEVIDENWPELSIATVRGWLE